MRVNGLRQDLGTVLQSVASLRHQAPHLAARNGPTARRFGLSEDLALAICVTVALVGVGSHAGGQPIAFPVTSPGPVADLTFGQDCETRLAAAGIELGEARVRCAVERSAGELGVDIGAHAAVAPHRFSCEEAAGEADRGSLEMNRGRSLSGLIYVLLLALNRLS